MLLLVLLPGAGMAQDALLEQIAGETVPTPDLDRIEYYRDNPILLDSASVDQLTELPFISRSLARRILSRLHAQRFSSVAELCGAIECTEEQRYVLERCTRLAGEPALGFPLSLRTRAMLWATPPVASTDGRFRGSSAELYNRVFATVGQTTISALTNKDAGEPLVADFASISIGSRLGSTRLVIGDYYAELGMGLVLWRPFGARKGTDVITPCTETGRGLVQYRSALEYRFFRGIAVEQPFAIGDSTEVLLRGGISALPRSATLDTASGTLSSLATDGYHRTTSELARRHQITEQAAIAGAELRTAHATLGIAVLALAYPFPITSTSSLVISGQQGIFGSVYGAMTRDRLSWTIECARDYAANLAFRTGLEYRLDHTTLALGLRRYAPTFRAPYGYNFGESSQPTNEEGIYLGIRSFVAKGIQYLAYGDIYRHAATTGSLPRVRRGVDLFNELRIRIGSSTLLLVRLRQEHRTDDRSMESGTMAEEILRTILRCEIQHSTPGGIIARFRIERVWPIATESVATSSEGGIAAFAEVTIPLSQQLSIGGRCTMYRTDSFNAAVYTFEQLTPGLLVSVPLYGSGSRSFGFVRWQPLDRITLWVRYGSTERLNVASLGSGLTEVPGTHEGRAYIQLDVRL
ncbi:MAG: hypothetical protein KatS3mg039_1439 [Candidatus Kapaibacterium sp.]|nr:MAG: hypothetical protein KatS3mg039_1439 [Candidatus Kapabacteria bacterium]